MWLFSQRGFFSIIHKDKDTLTVRSRLKGDIETYWPNAKVIATPKRDYLYRADIPRAEVAAVISKMVTDINYTNFKNSIYDQQRRSPFYQEVWATMLLMQINEEPHDRRNPKKRRRSDAG